MICDCLEICQLADRFTPATRELMVFTKSSKRFFDMDAVREPYSDLTMKVHGKTLRGETGGINGPKSTLTRGLTNQKLTHSGAPPLDWWQIPSPKPQPVTEYQGDPMTATFYVGDAIETMNKLPEKSVDLILTSPPFLALRSYLPADHPDKALEGGSQATPGAFIDWLVDVVEACDRVLAPHGSLCIELGDTYAGAMPPYGYTDAHSSVKARTKTRRDGLENEILGIVSGGARAGAGWPLAKSLSLIPELFRLTLVYGTNPLTGRQTERWRLRNVVRWVRPNPPVGALGDKFRPATSELMVFCKSAKRYFDLDAVRSEAQGQPNFPSNGPKSIEREVLGIDGQGRYAQRIDSNPAGAPPLDWWNIPLLEGEEETRYGPKPKEYRQEVGRLEGDKRGAKTDGGWSTLGNWNPETSLGAPPLDWWNIPPGGYEGAHYAVFPPELCIKPIKAMCPERVCKVCGEPSRRIVGETEYHSTNGGRVVLNMQEGERLAEGVNQWKGPQGRPGHYVASAPTLGFSDCGHNDWRPGLVLDPFGGSGTTALVATGHGRDCILIDLDERNYELALQRVGPFILERAG